MFIEKMHGKPTEPPRVWWNSHHLISDVHFVSSEQVPEIRTYHDS